MWLVTTTGFFSVVRSDAAGSGVQVRARVRADLEQLRRTCRLSVPILETPRADYPVRLLLTAATWKRVAAQLAREPLAYDNFKAAVAATDLRRSAVMHDVWDALKELERLEEVE